MKEIRQYAAANGHEIQGKLTRRKDLERIKGDRIYADDAGNVYLRVSWGGVCIVTVDGAVI